MNTLATVIGIFFVKTFGRKSLLLYGHSGICVSHLLIAIFTITVFDAGVLAMICVFVFVYSTSSGPVAWLYAAETCCDVGLAVCLQTLWATVLILTLTTEPLMDSALQPQGVFFLLSGFSFIALFFIYFKMDETKGLSEKQKKALYIPGAKFGRKLKSGE